MTIDELADREAIKECMYRYCRAVDRADEQLLRSIYWPDATDRHGAYSGSADGFIEFALKAFRVTEPGIHQVHNILIEFREGGAWVESYFSAWNEIPTADGIVNAHQKGRYLDWFEKRGAAWKVKDRTVVFDYMERLPMPEGERAARFGGSVTIGGSHPDDPVYTARS
ncbi:nuclear transport factor 2 family protein [Sphingomonas sp. TX0543]|uniref:nuclear transport factor 2 family protein n=1 Tax=Sphingomonas sp. TX0543 TaxID=3399682 RepID=UPI003AFA4E45